MSIAPPAANQFRWYTNRSPRVARDRAEQAKWWRNIRKTERFELRNLLWRRCELVRRCLRAQMDETYKQMGIL